ncbi:site-specific DNA-methyltransferase [Mycoplasmopsis cynos]|uniref:site-specific DNA-methyltransferase n=1 Tax=Mycoplasmopsis cynos TaxID=171284 RepID=UPI0024CC6F3F|nr:site-specific DNA-methyltransferase [Mycoplasmopsis cynos]WAM03704.1 site-specific DNA-methyltransferase [Mycoplasmopsis cynos]
MDERLLTLLLSDENIKNIFFKNVNGTLVFDKQKKFVRFIESKEFYQIHILDIQIRLV